LNTFSTHLISSLLIGLPLLCFTTEFSAIMHQLVLSLLLFKYMQCRNFILCTHHSHQFSIKLYICVCVCVCVCVHIHTYIHTYTLNTL
jgi:hypothetical protein